MQRLHLNRKRIYLLLIAFHLCAPGHARWTSPVSHSPRMLGYSTSGGAACCGRVEGLESLQKIAMQHQRCPHCVQRVCIKAVFLFILSSGCFKPMISASDWICLCSWCANFCFLAMTAFSQNECSILRTGMPCARMLCYWLQSMCASANKKVLQQSKHRI